MPLKVIPADSKDAQRAVEIEDAAYGPNELSPYLFPGPHDETEVDSRTKKLVANLESSPFCRWMQAVDEDLAAQGKESMVAFSMWYVWDNPPPKEEHTSMRPPPPRGPGTNPEACELFFGSMRDKLSERLAGKPHVCKLVHI